MPRNGLKNDGFHPPIHPLKLGTCLKDNEARLFNLITRHFLACLSTNAVGLETKIVVDCIGGCHENDNWPRQFSG